MDLEENSDCLNLLETSELRSLCTYAEQLSSLLTEPVPGSPNRPSTGRTFPVCAKPICTQERNGLTMAFLEREILWLCGAALLARR